MSKREQNPRYAAHNGLTYGLLASRRICEILWRPASLIRQAFYARDPGNNAACFSFDSSRRAMLAQWLAGSSLR
jgi:hypothetical protein